MNDVPTPPLLKRIDNFVRGLANGLTFGQADTIAAAGDTLVDGLTGGNRKTLAASFEENQRAQNAKTTQAHTEGTALREGQALGALGLAVGTFRILGGFTRMAESGLRYSDILFKAGRAIRHRSPSEMAIVAGRATIPAFDVSKGSMVIAAGAGIVSNEINDRKVAQRTDLSRPQPPKP